jgi:AcrR family transcriptional regulator
MAEQRRLFDRDDIVAAAFSLLRREGWKAVSVRAVARELGASTMPLYSHVHSAEELEQELRREGRRLLQSYQRAPYTEDPLLDMAFGYIRFARDEGALFRFLFQESVEVELPESFAKMRQHLQEEFSAESGGNELLQRLSPAAQEELIRNSWIYTHGLASLVNSGTLGHCTDAELLDYLRSSGEAFYLRLLYGSGSGE